MQNNETLRRIAAALHLTPEDLARLVGLAGLEDRIGNPPGLLLDPGTPEHAPCDDTTMLALLDALIVLRRGPSDRPAPAQQRVDNTTVLKKLRIALDLRDAEMITLFESAGVHLRRSQLGALFRAPGNKHFHPCDDGMLLCFLTALGRRKS